MTTIKEKTCFELDYETRLCKEIDIRELTIEDCHNYYSTNQFTSFDLTTTYLNRIEQLNPFLKAVIEINPTAINEAKQLDEYLKVSKKFKGKLHGVPILVKDNISTLDGTETCAGSWALVGVNPKREATVIELLKLEGVIILGKANMTEFAGYRDFIDPLGWSGRGGQTCNPYNLLSHPSGSSGGSAVAVAANLCLCSLGSETDGSITAPASLASIVGLKPSVGMSSRAGVIPLSSSQDSIGAFSRTVKDNQLITSAFYNKYDSRDEATKDALLNPNLTLFEQIDLKNIRVGVLRYPYFEDEHVQSNLSELNGFISQLNQIGITVIDDLTLNTNTFSEEKEEIVFDHELKYYLNQYLKHEVTYSNENDNKIDCLGKIIQFNIDNPDLELYQHDHRYLIQSNNTTDLNDRNYVNCLKSNLDGVNESLNEIISKYQLDIFIGPSEPSAIFFTPSAILGWPIITLPIGYHGSHIPFGIAMFTSKFKEYLLYQIALQLEQKGLINRKLPEFESEQSHVNIIIP